MEGGRGTGCGEADRREGCWDGWRDGSLCRRLIRVEVLDSSLRPHHTPLTVLFLRQHTPPPSTRRFGSAPSSISPLHWLDRYQMGADGFHDPKAGIRCQKGGGEVGGG